MIATSVDRKVLLEEVARQPGRAVAEAASMKNRAHKDPHLRAETTLSAKPVSSVAEWRRTLEEHALLLLSHVDSREEFLRVAQVFGQPIRQYDGGIFQAIRARPDSDDLYHAQSVNELKPHTEACELVGTPHRFQALRCVHSGRDSGGITYVCDFRPFIEEVLTSAERDLLRTRRIRFASTPGLRSEGVRLAAVHPILSEARSGRRFILRFSLACMSYQADPELTRVVRKAERFHTEQSVKISWSEGKVLVWDNHRCLHSRSAYTDRSRQLERLWISERP